MEQPPDQRRKRLAGDAAEVVEDIRRRSARQRIEPAAEAWRRERLYLYLFWLEHRDRSPFNYVGGWHNADIGDELARWRKTLRGLDGPAALELVDRELSLRFGKTWETAQLEGVSSHLATAHLPVWNAATGSLLPAQLGPLTIFRAESYPGRPGLGWSYTYGRFDSSAKLTLTLYNRGLSASDGELNEPRILEELAAAWRDVSEKIDVSGGTLDRGSIVGPLQESLLDRYNRPVALQTMRCGALDSDTVARVEVICLREFRGHFLKVRYTRRTDEGSADAARQSMDSIKADLADFVASYA